MKTAHLSSSQVNNNVHRILLFLCLFYSANSTSRRQTKDESVPTFAPSYSASAEIVSGPKVTFEPVGTTSPTATAVPSQRFQLVHHFSTNRTGPTAAKTNTSASPVLPKAIPTKRPTGRPTLATHDPRSIHRPPTAPHTSNKQPTLRTCVKDWSAFSDEISSIHKGQNVLVEICAQSKLQVVKSIVIRNATSLIIRCGKNGFQDDNCVINGGNEQIRIDGSSQEVIFQGITLRSSTNVSIAISSASSVVRFQYCLWMRHVGSAAIFTFQEASKTSRPSRLLSFARVVFLRYLGTTLTSKPNSNSEISFTSCSFKENNFSRYIIQGNFTTNLQIKASTFMDNLVRGSIITVAGRLAVQRSCFIRNLFSRVLVSSNGNSTISSAMNYESNNTLVTNATGCHGIYNRNKCTQFLEPLCSAMDCLDDWATLSAVALATNGSRTLELCSNSFFDLSFLPPIKLNLSNIIVSCGRNGYSRNNCVISGGTYQFEITGTTTGIEFKGVTFVSSTIASINARASRASKVAFIDCVFRNHTGLAVILDYDQGNVTESKALPSAVSSVKPPPEPSMTVKISGCTFENNDVEYSAIANIGGSMVIEGTSFSNNKAMAGGGAVGVWLGGGVQLSQSCFFGTKGKVSGAIYVSHNSSIQLKRDSYSEGGSEGTGSCTDIFLDGFCQSEGVCKGICRAMTGTACSAFTTPPSESPSQAPSTAPVAALFVGRCYTTWPELSAAISSAGSKGDVVSVCSGAVLRVDSPIILDSPVLVVCGEDGQPTNNCTVSGGKFQFVVNTDKVVLKGLTFIGSSVASILAAGAPNKSVTFNACQWKGNSGVAVVLAYHETAGNGFTEQTDLTQLTTPPGGSMDLKINACSFSDNSPTWSTVASVAGPIHIQNSMFSSNRGSKVGVVSATAGASVNITTSCFMDNAAQLPGTVFVDKQSKVIDNSQNFGYNNKAGKVGGTCTETFQETSGTCFAIGKPCLGLCSDFDSPKCLVPQLGSPDLAPSLAPSASETSFSTKAPPNLRTSKEAFATSPIFLRNNGASLFLVGGAIFSFFYIKGQQAVASLKDGEHHCEGSHVSMRSKITRRSHY